MEKNQMTEKFKTTIGGQALIEGIMMRGPKKDCIVVRQGNELNVDVRERKFPKEKSIWTWPVFRGMQGFFDAQVTGVKALMHSADLSPEATGEEPSKFDKWLDKKFGWEKVEKFLMGAASVLGVIIPIVLFTVKI